jgi:MFS family permease
MAVFSDVTAATISGAFAFGMVLTLFGSLKLALSRRFDDNPNTEHESEMAWLVFAFNAALIPMVLISGVLLDWLSAPYLMILGSILTGGALFSLALTGRGKTDFHRAMIASGVLGLGGACLLTSSLFLMPKAFFASDPTVNNITSASVNMGTVFIALGAMTMPVLADLLLRLARFRMTLVLLAMLALVPIALVLMTNFAEFQPKMQQLGSGDTKAYPWEAYRSHDLSPLFSPTLWSNWRLWVLAGICFVYLPVEFSITTWGTTFLRDHAYKEGSSTYLMSCFWLTFVVSRLIVAVLALNGTLPADWNLALVAAMAFLSAICLGNLASSGRPGRALAGLFILGLLLGPIFPTLMAAAFNDSDIRDLPKGTSFGVIYATGSLGALLLTPLIGKWAGKQNVRLALYLPLILMVILGTLALMAAATHQPVTTD